MKVFLCGLLAAVLLFAAACATGEEKPLLCDDEITIGDVHTRLSFTNTTDVYATAWAQDNTLPMLEERGYASMLSVAQQEIFHAIRNELTYIITATSPAEIAWAARACWQVLSPSEDLSDALTRRNGANGDGTHLIITTPALYLFYNSVGCVVLLHVQPAPEIAAPPPQTLVMEIPLAYTEPIHDEEEEAAEKESNEEANDESNKEAANEASERATPVNPCTQALDALMARFGRGISVYFENLETGFVYSHNASRVFFGASISKAFYSLYLLERAERGEIDMNETLTFTQADMNMGSGVIAHTYPVGTVFTVRELIRLNLNHSDNVATLMLRRRFGTAGYREFSAALGANPHRVRDRVMDSMLTAYDAGVFMRAIYAYIAADKAYSREFLGALLTNQYPFTVSDYPLASKTGWTRGYAWHCVAIVYAPSPYILVIMTARNGWTDQDYADFAEISMAFQAFNTEWFTAG